MFIFGKKKTLRIFPIGGIGNQLFIYFAGVCLASKQKADLVLDFSHIWFIGNRRSTELLEFALPLQCRVRGLNEGSTAKCIKAKLEFAGSKWLRKVYLSREIGFADDLLMSNRSKIYGHFQTWKYASDVVRENPEFCKLEVKTVSNWLRDHIKLIKDENPLVIHIRRGDYLEHAESIGVLSDTYFRHAICSFSEDLRRRIWVFSDDVQAAQVVCDRIGVKPLRYIDQPPGETSASILYLMSLSRYMVISNSTFSWWGAFVNAHKEIVAPFPWFKGLESPRNLIPSNWRIVESTWL